MTLRVILLLCLSLTLPTELIANSSGRIDSAEIATLISRIKTNTRGPYERIAWHCKDGSILPPTAYACSNRGGGRQHGVLNADALKLNSAGIFTGTVLATLKPTDLSAHSFYRSRALLIEFFLENNLDGWALQSAKTYRGFRQAEDEEAAADTLLEFLASKEAWVKRHRYLAVRLSRTLPSADESNLTNDIRALATKISDKNASFQGIRSKIHSTLEPGDANAVLRYIEKNSAVADWGKELAEKIRIYYDPNQRRARLRRFERTINEKSITLPLHEMSSKEMDAFERIRLAEKILANSARILENSTDPRSKANILKLMSTLEEILVSETASIRGANMLREQAIELVENLIRSAHSLGILSSRELMALTPYVARMKSGKTGDYTAGLSHIQRSAEWARALLLSELGTGLQRYLLAEPRAAGIIDEILRSGAMLPLAAATDRIATDIESLRGHHHQLIGLKGNSVRGENAGLSIGPLRVREHHDSPKGLKRNDIVLLYELPSELPPVAGIITVGAPGSLSHVALLVRNLGIPLVSIDGETAAVIKSWQGQEIVVGVSASNRVVMGELSAFKEEDRILLGRSSIKDKPFLRIPRENLNLKSSGILNLSELSEEDSGVRVGPKAGELARLKRLFPNRVSDAVVIPFGLFVAHVNRAGTDGSPSPLSRLKWAYAHAATQHETQREEFLLEELARFRKNIQTLPFPEGFERGVDEALRRLGEPESFGVFVRSDTNVEDLKEFTGAGLNLTVPNLVNRASILSAIRSVWSSPYTERSYAWRQRILLDPEHVFPSVILHKTVPADISGVLVTMDLETGDPTSITVSASEGVAAVVDSGLPETIVVPKSGGQIRWLSSSRSASRKAVPALPKEGLESLLSQGFEPLLTQPRLDEIQRVVARLETIKRADTSIPWDVEFGFVNDKMYLMQLRPLKSSRAAIRQPFLQRLDQEGTPRPSTVDMSKPLKR